MCFHKSPTTRVSTAYNNAEILAYNGIIPAPPCDGNCFDFRMTSTKGSRHAKPGCTKTRQPYYGYSVERRPEMFPKTNQIMPDGLYEYT